ncbi:protein of unknown function [Micromonospora echinofusca]|uniref:DUF397 domain-containing protein n=1 Tax=Micromonospora echinofusca TaxID=47858 RepID=A0A1C5G707_MICEH|nr:DUF397 domain-containing protein [Micromonospora echinofusca]SCG15541.1 protein of unknown function [Micromonospora echinofusca]
MSDPTFRHWRKSTRSDGGQNCVEVSDAVDGSVMRVRDSKDKTGPVLAFTGEGWAAFIAGAKAGAFDLA